MKKNSPLFACASPQSKYNNECLSALFVLHPLGLFNDMSV